MTQAEKHPRGLFVLFGTEMWERFSFYTVNGMLVLYVTNAVQGFGFTNSQGATLSSWYQGFIYFTPLLGGLLADRALGFRHAITIGGLFFMAGHALLAVPNNLGIFYAALACLVIGNGFFKPSVSSMVGNLYEDGSRLKDQAYLIFYMGINVGATAAPLVAEFMRTRYGFHPAFFMGAIGMTFSLIVFWSNQKHVRHADRRTVLAPVSVDAARDGKAAAINAIPEWKRICALIVIFLIVIVFWMAFHQNSITVTFWANDHTDWNLTGIISNAINPGWIIILALPMAAFWGWLDKRKLEPSTPLKMMFGMLFTALAFAILALAAHRGGFTKPAFRVVKIEPAATWVSISPEAREHLGINLPPTPIDALSPRDKKMITVDAWRVTSAQPVTMPAFVRFERVENGEILVSPTRRMSPWWLIVAYMVLSIGELMLSPMGLSLVSKVAPVRMRGLMMGGWFTATAIGNKLTAIGKFWDLWSHSVFFITLSAFAVLMAIVLVVLLRPLKKAMPGV